MRDIGLPSSAAGISGPFGSAAVGINDAGLVVGYWWAHNVPRGGAFKWQNGIFTDLPTVNGGRPIACAVNNRGQIVGLIGQSAVIWEGDTVTYLPRMEHQQFSDALGINEAGDIVGEVCNGPDTEFHAARWHNRSV